VARDTWVSLIRSKSTREPLIEIIVAAKAIRERLDPFVDGRATRFFQAWNTADIDQVHWAFGFEGRSLYCRTYSRRGDLTRRMVYAGEVYATPRLLATVPDPATYAIYRVSVASFLPKLIESYYATRSPDDRVAAEQRWAKVESELGLDAQRDALALLGNNIVLHNFPQHPFRMPLAFTSLIEIKREPQRVRETLEKLCRAWKNALQKEADEKGIVNPAILFRDDDGVWFLRIGPVAGLSWTFTERFIVTSWSPHALREYLAKAGDAIGSRD